MGKRPAPTKSDIVKMQALHELGNSYRQIGLALNLSGHTVAKYIKQELSPEDKERVKELVEKIRETELEDLTIIGAKARARLHELLDEGKVRPIEATAIMDRSFQQRQLLQGRATERVTITALSEEKRRELKEIAKLYAERRLQKIREELHRGD